MGDRECSPVGDRTEPNNPPTAHGWTAFTGQFGWDVEHDTGSCVDVRGGCSTEAMTAAQADLARCIEDAAALPGVRAERDALAAKLTEARRLAAQQSQHRVDPDRADSCSLCALLALLASPDDGDGVG